MKAHNFEDWLVEFDIPPLGGQPDPGGMQAPGSTPDTSDPSVANMPPQGMEPEQPDKDDDVTNDPHSPDMPEEKDDNTDFETWRQGYFKELIKGDTNELIDLIQKVRDRNLESYQRKFVEDNLQIQFIREYSDVLKASKEIIKNAKGELDKNHPAVSLTNHMTLSLETNPVLNHFFIKCLGLWGAKGDVHRKFLAALLNAAQVGGAGMETEDIVYNENDFAARISTRFNTQFGNTILGAWSLREDDPERYLKPPELKRLQEGSPEEKDVLRRRVVLDSIVNKFKIRAFMITGVTQEGTIQHLGMDLAEMLKSSYKEGKLVVRTKSSENSEAMIDNEGKILPYIDLFIKYVRPTGQEDPDGKPEVEELDFMEKKMGNLFLTADVDVLKDASTTLQGVVFKEVPYSGNPSELHSIMRCVPSVAEILTRKC